AGCRRRADRQPVRRLSGRTRPGGVQCDQVRTGRHRGPMRELRCDPGQELNVPDDPAAALPDPHRTTATRMLVIRHGQTTWGAEGKFAGREDVPLTPRGRRQASSAAQRLRRLAPVAVLTSPLQRCRLTAEAIAGAVDAEVLVRDELLDGTLGQ